MMGNRGVLHDDQRRIVRATQLKRWITCRLEFRGRRRVVMKPGSYTELFFLDEAAAFSAGHGPCAECRNADYKRFQGLWEKCFGVRVRAGEIDEVLHGERLQGRAKRTSHADISTLPDGTYISIDGTALIVWGQELAGWTDRGYTEPFPRPARGEAEVLTPASIVAVFRAGYKPQVHPSLLA